MGNSKVIFGNETLIDLTGDTVTPDTLLAGTTAHNRSGNQIVGTATVPDTLDDLTDVDLTSPAEGDLLQYDATEQKWVNSAAVPNALAAVRDNGAINYAPMTLTSQTVSGVTLTAADDDTIATNGTTSGIIDLTITPTNLQDYLPRDKALRITGCTPGGGYNNFGLWLCGSVNGAADAILYADYGAGSQFTLNSADTITNLRVRLFSRVGQNLTGKIFKFMISDAALNLSYDDYQPYSMTNRELTEEVIDLSQRGRFDGFSGAGFHNSLYRGKYLGGAVSAEQWAQISAGTFDDLFIGDYWTIPTSITIGGTTTTTNINYRIAAFDYFLNCGDTNTTAHHIVIVPDTNLYSEKMNDSDTTAGGYIGSQMYTTYLSPAKDAIKTVFGTSHILSHRVFLTNAVTDGYASGCAWASSDIELMCEQMVYGNGIFSPASTGAITPANYRVEKSQLPLFALEPSRIAIRNAWWLRDVISNFAFANVNGSGDSNDGYARYSRGVRPAFCIIG